MAITDGQCKNNGIMKTIILILALCISQIAFSQTAEQQKLIDLRMNQGQYLQKGSKQIIGGALIMLGGSILMATSNGDKVPMAIGGLVATGGFILTLNGVGNIGLAGKSKR